MAFDKEMTMGEILAMNPEARIVLEGFGMHCCGCPVSQAEALEDACDAHGVDVELVLAELNALEEEECGCACCCGHHHFEDEDEEEFDDDECECGDDCDCTEDDNCGCTCWQDEEK